MKEQKTRFDQEHSGDLAGAGIDGAVMDRFSRLFRGGRLAHAYLFSGPKGIGKFLTAVAAARWINCEERDGPEKTRSVSCGTCVSCRKIQGGNHPDVRIIDAGEGNSIKISEVREITSQIQLRPYEAQKKVYIFRNAENLTSDAGNALLKTLEEPARDSLIILTTSSPDRMLGTILSRCHLMTFFPFSSRSLREELKNGYSMNEEEAAFFAGYSQGCRERSLQLSRDRFLEKKNEMIDRMVLEENSEAYLKDVLSDKASLRELLDVLLSWFRDVLLIKNGIQRDQVVHADRYNDLSRLARSYSCRQVSDIIGQIIDAIKMLNENLNVKIPLALIREKIWVKA